MSDRCRICDNGDGNVKHQVREMMFGLREEFTYLECASCGCLQIESTPEDIARYYPENYYAYEDTWRHPPNWKQFLKQRHGQYETGRWNVVGWAVQQRFPHWTIPWLGMAAPALDDPILDVGCGSGGALNELAERGYRSLTGVDPFIERDINYDNGVRILKRDLIDVDGRYRLVMCHHAFEHMTNPESSLRHMARLLEPGCLAVIRIPVSRCSAWQQYGVNWIQIDAPRHMFLHNERTMAMLASRVGMVVENVVYDSNAFQFAGSEGYARDIPFVDQPAAKLFSQDEIRKFDEQADTLNAAKMGDQAAFYLRRT